jgi:hypothetical protein
MKIAILISGELRTFWYCLKSQYEYLIKNNNADVFILANPYSHGRNAHPLNKNKEIKQKFLNTGGSYDSRHTEKWIDFDEKKFAKDILGDHLKKFIFVNELNNYYGELNSIYNEKRKLFESKANRNGEKLYDQNGIEFDHSHYGPAKTVVDQYYAVNKCFEMIEEYENENNFKYDIIFRIRPDFALLNEFNIKRLFSHNEDIYIRNNPIIENKYYCSDYIFFGKRDIVAHICKNFYKEHGNSLYPFDLFMNNLNQNHRNHILNKIKNQVRNSNYVAECCFGLFLSKIDCNKIILQDRNCAHVLKEINIDENYNEISKEFNIKKVVTYCIPIQYKPITYIYSTHFNMPEYIDLQYKSIKKYFDCDYEFIVINDAKTYGDLTNFDQDDLEEKINNVCNINDIQCVRFPQDYHKNRTILFPNTKEPNTQNAVTRCADVVQFALNHFVKNYNRGNLMILDADMFFINNFNINNFMNNANLAGIRQRMGYLWNGINIFNTELNVSELNFDCGYVNDEPVDVGGQTYYFMKKYEDIIKYKPISCSHYTFEETFQDESDNIKNILLEYCKLREDKSANKEIILNNTILHIRSGGNWDYRTKEFKYKELEIIKKYIENI